MNTGENLFRGAVVGGFNREDVTAYLEKISASHSEELSALRRSLDAAETARASAETAARDHEETTARQSQRIAELMDEVVSLTRERDSLKAASQQQEEELSEVNSLKAQVTVLSELQRALAQKNDIIAKAENELSILRGEQEALRADAMAYHSLKDRLATIELEAHQRAQEAEDAAAQHVTQLRAETSAWLKELCRACEAWCTGVDESVSRSKRELSALLLSLDDVTARVEAGKAALGGLADFYQALTEKKPEEE